MTNSDTGVVPFLLLYCQPLPKFHDDQAPVEPQVIETRITKAERETTDDE